MTASTAGVTQVITVKKPYTVKVPGHRDGLSGQAMSQAFGFRFASLVRPLRGRAGAVASPHRQQVQVPLRHCARLRHSAQMFSAERHGGSHHSNIERQGSVVCRLIASELRLPFRQVVLRLVGCEVTLLHFISVCCLDSGEGGTSSTCHVQEAMVLRAPAPGLPRTPVQS